MKVTVKTKGKTAKVTVKPRDPNYIKKKGTGTA